MRSFAPIAAFAVLSIPTTANACAPPMVQFPYGSALIPPKGKKEVSLVLKEVRALPRARVKLTAQTDGTALNLKMARRRAGAIKEALALGGVTKERVDVDYARGLQGSDARIVLIWVVSAPTCGA